MTGALRRRCRSWIDVIRDRPVLALLLLGNVGWSAILVLDLTAHGWLWVAVGLLALLLAPSPPAVARGSPLAFLVALLALASGEFYLRLHPEQVGGGGGGNPALHQIYADLYSYNALGLRGPEIPAEPAPGTFRILAVGDSFTFGQGVAQADTYPAALQALLDARHGATRCEVVNAGQCGRDLSGAADSLRDEGLALRPHLIVLQFYLNDVEERAAPATATATGGLSGLSRWIRAPLRSSYVLFFLRDRFRSDRESLDRYIDAIAGNIARNGRKWRDCAAALDTCAALARNAGIPLLVALFPHPGPPREAVAAIHTAVAAYCRQAGMRVVDLRAAVAAVPPAAQVVNAFDQHGSPAYNRAAAQGILSALQAEELLPR